MEDLIAPLPPYLFATTLHCHFLCASHFQRSNTTVTAGVCIFGIADVPFPFRAAALKTGRKPACLSLIIQYSMENRKQGHHMVGGAAEITRVLGGSSHEGKYTGMTGCAPWRPHGWKKQRKLSTCWILFLCNQKYETI